MHNAEDGQKDKSAQVIKCTFLNNRQILALVYLSKERVDAAKNPVMEALLVSIIGEKYKLYEI
ncbi:MAG: hypothetical protein CVV13_13015 [Gammaproteobacteria bacterium HGW-Gammaproteobacteria-3]|nr:MAG: hypothetical protein CVV13_13015 [Gammaproteobacteria bacterium HGW-Gammaproteobacteria-3]